MSAPTPVRALVHSRTLVTAGVLLLFKFSFELLGGFPSGALFVGGLLTLLLASLKALVEEDLKKKVALRTLSQIGLAVLTFGLGFHSLSIVHLISHGLFKRLLFLQVGFLIHVRLRQQDCRQFCGAGRTPSLLQIQLGVSLTSLCGLFFTNGLVTKDAILELVYSRG